MSQESLRDLLLRVRTRLSEDASPDKESRAQLDSVVRDIEQTLAARDSGTARADQAPRLESLAVRFEAGHPALAETLRELMDALVKAGI